MTKWLVSMCSAILVAVGAVAPAVATEHDHDVPEHPHVMLTNFEVVDVGDPSTPMDDEVAFDQCIDLAGGNAIPLEAHHHSLHTGTAGFGDPSVGITRAGHVVVPLEPYPGGLPFDGCDEIEAIFG